MGLLPEECDGRCRAEGGAFYFADHIIRIAEQPFDAVCGRMDRRRRSIAFLGLKRP